MAKTNISNLSMNLFGIPYQFPKAVDPRMALVSSSVGKKFTENIMFEAPVCTIIPGVPSYLPGKKKSKKISTAQALLEGQAGNFNALEQILSDNKAKNMRLYDFQTAYVEYMKYVNVLCRAGASFLELEDTMTAGSHIYSFQRYDWRNYRWNVNAQKSLAKRTYTGLSSLVKEAAASLKKSKTKTKKTSSSNGSSSTSTDTTDTYTTAKNAKNTTSTQFMMETSDDSDTSEKSLKSVLKNYNYVQFYIDSDVSPSENLSNASSESMIKGALESGSSTMKDLAFMANSGGIDDTTLGKFTTESAAALQSGIESILGNGTGPIARIVNLGSDVLKGNNIIIPDIYNSTTYTKSYSITVHLKSPYGTKLGYYLDIFVPMMHLLALTAPRQQSANSYSSPFLVKAYVDGIFTCNLGLVTGITIQKVSESRSVAGLPSEVDVTLDIVDLYSDLMMTPSSSPTQFINNSSLIEYIATNCGLDLTAPNYEAKWNNVVNTMMSSFTDIPTTITSSVEQSIYNVISSVIKLY